MIERQRIARYRSNRIVVCKTTTFVADIVRSRRLIVMCGWNVNLTRLSTVSVEATAVSPSTN